MTRVLSRPSSFRVKESMTFSPLSGQDVVDIVESYESLAVRLSRAMWSDQPDHLLAGFAVSLYSPDVIIGRLQVVDIGDDCPQDVVPRYLVAIFGLQSLWDEVSTQLWHDKFWQAVDEIVESIMSVQDVTALGSST